MKKMPYFLGIDTGSVSANFALIGEREELVHSIYLRTFGNPIEAVKTGLREISEKFGTSSIARVGVTGSARELIGLLIDADIVKNEITAHAVAAIRALPEVKTVIEIGGQDSKIIIIRNGIVVDFAMNTVCAAGTGSFLDHQAERLKVPIEDFGDYALKARSSIRIAGRCTVFAESDMIHKQATGASKEEIIRGLCEALARNYLSNVAKGKEIESPVLFQGGVAANKGMKKSLEEALDQKVIIPENYTVMGAIGAAILAKEADLKKQKARRLSLHNMPVASKGFECSGCSNTCEVVELKVGRSNSSYLGGRCGKWEGKNQMLV
jgi:predicted CoA-substrate-specific enzyme activase